MIMKHVLTRQENDIYFITLNNPEKGNCYDAEMTEEIASAFSHVPSSAKAILLRAEGKNFCTGADLNWMKRACELSAEENLQDMAKIKSMYQQILKCRVPVICQVQGQVAGGGMGLVAASDIVVSDQFSQFSLPEKKWGLIPGIITPILKSKIGVREFEHLSTNGDKIDVVEAQKIKLIHYFSDVKNIEKYIGDCFTLAREGKIQRPVLSNEMNEELEKYLILSAQKRQSGEFCEKVKRHFS